MVGISISISKAKSDRSKCRDCGKKIKKDEWRGEVDNDFGSKYNYCLDCAKDFKVQVDKEFKKAEASA